MFGIEVSGRRPLAVVELLLIDANRPVSVERITDELWPEEPPKSSRNSVQRFVADIRSALGPERHRLQTTATGYRLQVEPGELDIEVVREYRAQAEEMAGRPAEAAALLRMAIELFGVIDEDAGLTPSGRAAALEFEELRLQLIEQRMEAEILAGAAPTIVDELTTLTRRHPYREHLVAHLMRALELSGQRVAALRAYERFRRRLSEEIGIEPSNELKTLEQEILASGSEPAPTTSDETLAGDAPSTGAVDASHHGLVGRQDDLEALVGMLGCDRLVSIVGPGGVGKTSLAAAAAEVVREPSVFVRLAEIRNGNELPDLVAAALGVTPEGNTPTAVTEEVVDTLNRSRRLVVLDNAEHILDATTNFVRQILKHSPCPVIVTSREHLGLAGERVLRLGRLSMPSDDVDGDSESEMLFKLRAEAMGVDIAESGPLIGTVCDALDGLPLAIELAAAQMTFLGIRDLADRLDSMLEMSAHRPIENRHSSLAAVLQWSWDLLADDEAALLEQLAIFQTRLTATAVDELVGADGLRRLASLVAKNLVAASVEDGRVSYALPSSVRMFALARSVDSGVIDDYRQLHADYVLAYLRRWSIPETNSYHDVIAEVAIHRLEYVPALEYLDARELYDELIEMVVRVSGLWGRRGPGADLARWAERVLELRAEVSLNAETEAAVMVTALEARFRYSDYGNMSKYGERLVALEEQTPTDLGTPLVGFYGTASHQFMLDDLSRGRVERAFERAPQTASRELNLAQTQMWVGCCELMNREFEAAYESFSAVLSRTSRPGGTVLWSELGRAVALHLLDRNEEAWASFETMTSEADDSIWNYAIIVVRSVVRAALGEVEAARIELTEAAQQRIFDRKASSRDDFQIGFGLLARFADEPELAEELLRDAMPQSPVIAALLQNHVHNQPATPDEWQARWADDTSKRLISAMGRFSGDLASVEAELERWWPDRAPENA